MVESVGAKTSLDRMNHVNVLLFPWEASGTRDQTGRNSKILWIVRARDCFVLAKYQQGEQGDRGFEAKPTLPAGNRQEPAVRHKTLAVAGSQTSISMAWGLVRSSPRAWSDDLKELFEDQSRRKPWRRK